MTNIFIAYRRQDSADISGRIYDRLVATYGKQRVFKDVASLRGGQRFPARLENAINEHTIMLLVIGPQWLQATRERADDPHDFGRIEIEIALRQGATIIPLLILGATMPSHDELPPSIADLASYHSLEARSDPDFSHDVEDIKRTINLYYRTPRRLFPWIASVSIVLILAIVGGIVWRLGFLGFHSMAASPPATATPLPPCHYPDSFTAVGPLYQYAPAVPGISGQNIAIGGNGDAESAFANARVGFDMRNGTCTPFMQTQISSIGAVRQLLNGQANYQIAVSEFGINEIRTLQPYVGSVQNTQLGVIVQLVVVSKNVALHINNLSLQNLVGIYQKNPTITHWNQINSTAPDTAIVALWPGTSQTYPEIWPPITDTADLDTVNASSVAFKRNILANGEVNPNVMQMSSKQAALAYVAQHDNVIAFTSLESWYYYVKDQQGAVPIAIDGVMPVAADGTFSKTIVTDIASGKYVFWDITHAYITNDFANSTTPQSKAAQALINEVSSDAFGDSAFDALGWIPIHKIKEIAPQLLACHDQIDLCS